MNKLQNLPQAQSGIRLTQPLLPALDKYHERLKSVWSDQWLSNHGRCVVELEQLLQQHFKVPHVALCGNGTLALMLALKALDLPLGAKVLTTPFSFPATAHAISWLGLEPVFCDIDPLTLTLSVEQVENVLGQDREQQIQAILGVHLFGNLCDVVGLRRLADQYGIPLVFDAAHAFGAQMGDMSAANFGDISAFSLHATKLFHTAEGGVVCTRDETLNQRILDLRNFGIRDEFSVVAPGINAKMNELQAALGLEIYPLIEAEIQQRQQVKAFYRKNLASLEGIRVLETITGCQDNPCFMTVQIDQNSPWGNADQVYQRLRQHQIYARRYFSPLISEFAHYRQLPSAQPARLPQAQRAAAEVLCLPIYGELREEQVDMICALIQQDIKATSLSG